MAKAHICDRCGALITQDQPAWQVIVRIMAPVPQPWRWKDLSTNDKALCQGCAEQLWERQFLEPPRSAPAPVARPRQGWWRRREGETP